MPGVTRTPPLSTTHRCHVVSNMVANNGIDDAVDAIAVHLGAGTFGVIATAFFEKDIGIFYNWVRLT